MRPLTYDAGGKVLGGIRVVLYLEDHSKDPSGDAERSPDDETSSAEEADGGNGDDRRTEIDMGPWPDYDGESQADEREPFECLGLAVKEGEIPQPVVDGVQKRTLAPKDGSIDDDEHAGDYGEDDDQSGTIRIHGSYGSSSNFWNTAELHEAGWSTVTLSAGRPGFGQRAVNDGGSHLRFLISTTAYSFSGWNTSY